MPTCARCRPRLPRRAALIPAWMAPAPARCCSLASESSAWRPSHRPAVSRSPRPLRGAALLRAIPSHCRRPSRAQCLRCYPGRSGPCSGSDHGVGCALCRTRSLPRLPSRAGRWGAVGVLGFSAGQTRAPARLGQRAKGAESGFNFAAESGFNLQQNLGSICTQAVTCQCEITLDVCPSDLCKRSCLVIVDRNWARIPLAKT